MSPVMSNLIPLLSIQTKNMILELVVNSGFNIKQEHKALYRRLTRLSKLLRIYMTQRGFLNLDSLTSNSPINIRTDLNLLDMILLLIRNFFGAVTTL